MSTLVSKCLNGTLIAFISALTILSMKLDTSVLLMGLGSRRRHSVHLLYKCNTNLTLNDVAEAVTLPDFFLSFFFMCIMRNFHLYGMYYNCGRASVPLVLSNYIFIFSSFPSLDTKRSDRINKRERSRDVLSKWKEKKTLSLYLIKRKLISE